MHRDILTLVFFSAVATGAARAQVEPHTLSAGGRLLTVGDTLGGVLGADDERFANGSHAQAWRLNANGLTVTVDLLSEDFDAFLMLVEPGGDELITDDDGAGRCDSRITHTLASEGEYRIVVTTIDPGATGTYELRVSTDPGRPNPQACGGNTVPAEVVATVMALPVHGALRQSDELNGTLRPTDVTIGEDGPFAQAYELAAPETGGLAFELFSQEFDAVLLVSGPGIPSVLFDDDCGGGTDASLTVAFPDRETYRLIVTTYSPGETGSFTLFVTPVADADVARCRGLEVPLGEEEESLLDELRRAPPRGTITLGGDVTSALDEGDARMSDGSYAESWILEGTANTEVTIDLLSDEFDAYLWLIGPGLADPLFDDDGAGGCNARITVMFPETGRYHIVANSVMPQTAGVYTLRATAEPVPAGIAPCEG